MCVGAGRHSLGHGPNNPPGTGWGSWQPGCQGSYEMTGGQPPFLAHKILTDPAKLRQPTAAREAPRFLTLEASTSPTFASFVRVFCTDRRKRISFCAKLASLLRSDDRPLGPRESWWSPGPPYPLISGPQSPSTPEPELKIRDLVSPLQPSLQGANKWISGAWPSPQGMNDNVTQTPPSQKSKKGTSSSSHPSFFASGMSPEAGAKLQRAKQPGSSPKSHRPGTSPPEPRSPDLVPGQPE